MIMSQKFVDVQNLAVNQIVYWTLFKFTTYYCLIFRFCWNNAYFINMSEIYYLTITVALQFSSSSKHNKNHGIFFSIPLSSIHLSVMSSIGIKFIPGYISLYSHCTSQP